MPRSRSRSRSPRPTQKPPRGGFRWKEKPRRDDDNNNNGPTRAHTSKQNNYRPDRNYRDRNDEDTRRSYRDTERERNDAPRGERRGPDEDERRRARPAMAIDDDIAAKFGPAAAAAGATAQGAGTAAPPKDTKAPSTTTTNPKPRAPVGPLIVVKINDRLGTTTKVPCLPSDSIGDLKKLVAMRIGRKPHEIMLKRQSERPFKDFLTLEDYGVGDGVQLDLEIDTGD